MEHSPLAKLAPETRNCIYELVLHNDQPFDLDCFIRGECAELRSPAARIHPLALARMCSQLSKECLQMFYATNTFKFHIDSANDVSEILDDFRHAIGPHNSSTLSSIVVDMGSLDLTYGILEPGKIAGALHTAMRQLRQQAKTHSKCDFYLTITVVLASNFNPELPADIVLPITLDPQDLDGSFASTFDLVRR